jgi:hypothetical protein
MLKGRNTVAEVLHENPMILDDAENLIRLRNAKNKATKSAAIALK